MTALTLNERAVHLGLPPDRFAEIHARDPRSFASEAFATDGAMMRLRRWLDSGMADADARDACVVGDPGIAALVRATIARLPPVARRHAVTGIVWLVFPSGAHGAEIDLPALPRPPGDHLHAVILGGGTPPALIPVTVSHEAAHSFLEPYDPFVPRRPTMPAVTTPADLAPEVAAASREDEAAADALSCAWGFDVSAARAAVERGLAEVRAVRERTP